MPKSHHLLNTEKKFPKCHLQFSVVGVWLYVRSLWVASQQVAERTSWYAAWVVAQVLRLSPRMDGNLLVRTESWDVASFHRELLFLLLFNWLNAEETFCWSTLALGNLTCTCQVACFALHLAGFCLAMFAVVARIVDVKTKCILK